VPLLRREYSPINSLSHKASCAPAETQVELRIEGNGALMCAYELKGDILSWKVPARPDGSIPVTVLRRISAE
jgi:hypothetical protein